MWDNTNFWTVIASVIAVVGTAAVTWYFSKAQYTREDNQRAKLEMDAVIDVLELEDGVDYANFIEGIKDYPEAGWLIKALYHIKRLDSISNNDPNVGVIEISDINMNIKKLMKDKPELVDRVLNNYRSLAVVAEDQFNYKISSKGDIKLIDAFEFANIDGDLSEMIDKREVLVVRSFKDSANDDDILGSWIISKNKVNKIKILVGFSATERKILKSFEVSGYTEKYGKTTFVGKEIKGVDTNNVISELKNWNARNPILYFDGEKHTNG